MNDGNVSHFLKSYLGLFILKYLLSHPEILELQVL